MKVDISSLLLGSVDRIPINGTIDIGEAEKSSIKITFTKPINIKGEIYRRQGEIFADASIDYEYVEHCSRCLKEFTNHVSTSLSTKVIDRDRKPLVEDDEDLVIYYEGNRIDLESPIIASVLLSLPMKPLCSSDCRGLCLRCGKDLNKEQCDCITEAVDPRLAKLRELLD